MIAKDRSTKRPFVLSVRNECPEASAGIPIDAQPAIDTRHGRGHPRGITPGRALTLDAQVHKMNHIRKIASTVRTTITLEDDAFATAQAYAQARALKLGQAISDLIRRGSAERLALKQEGGVWVFDLPKGAPRVTAQQVKALLEESP